MSEPQTPDGAGGQAATTAPPAGQPAAGTGSETAAPSHKDWNGLVSTFREFTTTIKAQQDTLAKLIPAAEPAKKEPPPTGNASVDSMVAELKGRTAELDFRSALADAEVKGSQREALMLMWQGAGRPTEGLSEWVTKHRGLLGGPASNGAAPPVPPVQVTPPKAPSDTGAPVTVQSNDGRPQGHPLSWPLEIVAKMKPEEYRGAIKEFEDKGGGSSVMKYFDERRRAAEERRKPR